MPDMLSFVFSDNPLMRFAEEFKTGHSEEFIYSVNDLVDQYGRKGLAERFAAITGTKVKSQMENIRRWGNYESGMRGSQARNPGRDTSNAINKLRGELGPKSVRKPMNVTMTGTFKVSDEIREDRTINVDLDSSETEAFWDAIENNDIESAYEIMFAAYEVPSMEAGNDVSASFRL